MKNQRSRVWVLAFVCFSLYTSYAQELKVQKLADITVSGLTINSKDELLVYTSGFNFMPVVRYANYYDTNGVQLSSYDSAPMSYISCSPNSKRAVMHKAGSINADYYVVDNLYKFLSDRASSQIEHIDSLVSMK